MIPPPDHGKTHSDPGGGASSSGHDDARATADAGEKLLVWWQQRINQWLTDPQTLAQASQQWLRWQEWLATQGMTASTGAASPFAGTPPSPAPSPTNPAGQSDDHDTLKQLVNRLDQLEKRLADLEQQQQQRGGGFTPV
jgi:hypothetical protein